MHRRNAAATLLLLSALGLAAVSVWPWFWSIVPAPFHFMQFPYRLTSVENALIVSAALMVIWRLPEETRRVSKTSLPAIAVTLAVFACGVKLVHGYTALHIVPETPADYTHNFMVEAAALNYSLVPQTGRSAPVHASPPAVTFSAVGEPMPQHYVADRHGYVYTRIIALPWNAVIVDGRRLSESKKLSWRTSAFYGFSAAPGSGHEVQTAFDVPLVVDCAIRLAEYCVIVEFVAIIVLSFMRLGGTRIIERHQNSHSRVMCEE